MAFERVLTVLRMLGNGGTERAAVTFALEYARAGLASAMWAVEGGDPWIEELVAAGVHVVRGPGGMREAVDCRPDLIHLHANGLEENLVRGLVSSTSSVVVEQNVFARPSPWEELLQCSYQLTPGQLALYMSRTKRPQLPLAVVPNPVDTNAFYRDPDAGQKWRSSFGVPAEAVVIGRVGQPIPSKWSPLLFTAFDQVAARRSDTWLVVVAPPKIALHQIARMASRARVVVVPTIETDPGLRAAYSAMDIMAHAASQGESFGYVVAESMLCEVPVVTLSTPWGDNAQTELVKSGVTGIVAHTSREFVQSLQRLVDSPNERRVMGRTGRESIVSRFDAGHVAHLAIDAAAGNRLSSRSTPAPRSGKEMLMHSTTGEWLLPKLAFGAWRWLPGLAAARLVAKRDAR